VALREVLFTLWGDLEEKKSAHLKSREATTVEAASHATEVKVVRPGDDLPPDSDDENGPNGHVVARTSRPVLLEHDPNIRSELRNQDTDKNKPQPEAFSSIEVKNKGFACCIEEYGIKIPEKSPSKADAGRGMSWKRMFKIFGTRIS
jgi:protection of telomeres protein 1